MHSINVVVFPEIAHVLRAFVFMQDYTRVRQHDNMISVR